VDLIMAISHRFQRTPDGVVRTQTGFTSPFWARYLSSFDRVKVVARVQDVSSDHEGLAPAGAEGVSFIDVPTYVGPAQYLRMRRVIRDTLRGIDVRGSAVLLRVPGVVSFGLGRAMPAGYPFGVEVVGDPYDAFGPEGIQHPLRRLFRWWYSRELRSFCENAACSLYVTREALQRRYPPGKDAGPERSVGVADVELSDTAYLNGGDEPDHEALARRRRLQDDGRPLRLICVGMMEQLYKRQDVLIRGVAACASAGLHLSVTLVGGGRKMPELRALADSLGIAHLVDFKGTLAGGAAIREQLDAHDLFVLPSAQEGLPRALVEAMARGLPCIGTAVGGIPELLPEYALVPPDDVPALAGRIEAFARDPGLRERAARENFTIARSYRESVLQPRRVAFFGQVIRATEAWMAGTHP
jgi:glycosyltransferase involved in cell wall biosynthesis